MPWQYCNSKSFPKIFTPKSFFFLIGIKKTLFLEINNKKRLHYIKDKKIKKDGIRYREIYKPDKDLKHILKKINKKFLAKFSFPPFVHCGPKGKSIVTASKNHNNFNNHTSLDIDSFFDKITKKVLEDTLFAIGINKNITRLISCIATEDNKIPQGFPTSPLLSALVASFILQDFYLHFDRKLILFSVYADDILISSNDHNLIVLAEEYIKNQLGSIGLLLNSKKEVGKKGKKFLWLGLQIHPWVSIPRKKIVELQKKFYEYKTKGIIPNDFKPRRSGKIEKRWEQYIKGKVVFAQSVSNNKLIEKILKK